MRFVASVAVFGLAALVLGGCVEHPPPVVPTSTPSVAPVFASDADALVAAKKAYTGYLAASDGVAHDGGTDAERLSDWETLAQFQRTSSSFNYFTSHRIHMVGATTVSYFALQSVARDDHGRVAITAYACLDVMGTKLTNDAGKDVTPSRPGIVPLQLRFIGLPTTSHRLLLDGSDVWSGTDYC
jgi:hypothetical protein